MKYQSLLSQPEKDFIESLTQEFNLTLQHDFRSDFTTIKSALKDKFGSLKTSMDTTNLGILQAQVKKITEIYQYLESIESQMILDRDTYVQNIEEAFNNWK